MAETVLEFGTGALNVAACQNENAKWPTNVWHDASPDACRVLRDAARVLYVPKPSRSERDKGLTDANDHPTVKPVELMRQLVRLVTPPGGIVLDPFLGSGTTGMAAVSGGFRFIGIELDRPHMAKARRRVRLAHKVLVNNGRQLELF